MAVLVVATTAAITAFVVSYNPVILLILRIVFKTRDNADNNDRLCSEGCKLYEYCFFLVSP
jgi:hypothetical protein